MQQLPPQQQQALMQQLQQQEQAMLYHQQQQGMQGVPMWQPAGGAVHPSAQMGPSQSQLPHPGHQPRLSGLLRPRHVSQINKQ